jgi:hypothetical protein
MERKSINTLSNTGDNLLNQSLLYHCNDTYCSIRPGLATNKPRNSLLLHMIFCFCTWIPPSENQGTVGSFPGQASRPLGAEDNAEDGRLEEGKGKLSPPEVDEWL